MIHTVPGINTMHDKYTVFKTVCQVFFFFFKDLMRLYY